MNSTSVMHFKYLDLKMLFKFTLLCLQFQPFGKQTRFKFEQVVVCWPHQPRPGFAKRMHLFVTHECCTSVLCSGKHLEFPVYLLKSTHTWRALRSVSWGAETSTTFLSLLKCGFTNPGQHAAVGVKSFLLSSFWANNSEMFVSRQSEAGQPEEGRDVS